MKEVLKEIQTEIIDALRERMAAENAKSLPPEFANRFKAEAKHIKREEHGPGLATIATVEGTNVMIDFGEPVQVLGLTILDCQAFMEMLTGTMKAAMVQDLINTHDKTKAN